MRCGGALRDERSFLLRLESKLARIGVLRTLKDQIVPGTYIHFDEFSQRDHELRAIDELINETGMTFSLVGASRTLQHAVFKCTAYPEPVGTPKMQMSGTSSR
jgi:hypothetical protein